MDFDFTEQFTTVNITIFFNSAVKQKLVSNYFFSDNPTHTLHREFDEILQLHQVQIQWGKYVYLQNQKYSPNKK